MDAGKRAARARGLREDVGVIKSQVVDFLLAGAVLYGVSTFYDIVSYYVGFANNLVVTYCVIGYLALKTHAYLRNG